MKLQIADCRLQIGFADWIADLLLAHCANLAINLQSEI
jgi:hypothetical protein